MEGPLVAVTDGRLVLKAHLAGRVSGPVFTRPRVSSDLTIYMVPIVEGNVLRLEHVELETTSSSLLFKFGAGRFRQRAVTEIQQKGRYDFTPELEDAKTKISSKLQLQRGDRCLGVELGTLNIRSVAPVNNPEGVQVIFEAAVGLISTDSCQNAPK